MPFVMSTISRWCSSFNVFSLFLSADAGRICFAGIPSALSASAYFPRALLLQKLYGSFLYGALAERWKSKSPRNLKCKESDELLTRSDSTKKGEKLPSKLVSVKGATALTSEDATYQMIASEGRGIFSFRGGIRKVS